MEQERALDSDLVSHASNGERGSGSSASAPYDYAFEYLSTLPVSLPDAGADSDRIARPELINLRVRLDFDKLVGIHNSRL